MRRIWGYILLALGVFLIVLAIAVKFFVAPAVVKTPHTIPAKYTKILAYGTKFSYFDATVLKNVLINVSVTRTVVGDPVSGDGTATVYNESLCLTRDINGSHPGCVDKNNPKNQLISNSTDRVAFDRKTAMAIDDPKYHSNVDGDQSVVHVGLSYKFPIDTARKTYPYFDTVVRKAFPAHYAGQTNLQGLTVYKFVQKMVDEPVYTNNTFPSLYTNTRTVWVEPTTGQIIKGQEQLKQVLTGRENLSPTSPVTAPALTGIVALQGTLTFTPDTVAGQAQYAKDNLSKIHLVRLWLPLIALIVGIVAVIAAVVLLWRRREPGGDGAEEQPPGETLPPEQEPDYADQPTGRIETPQT